jgi:hypothetical protein
MLGHVSARHEIIGDRIERPTRYSLASPRYRFDSELGRSDEINGFS